MQEFIIFLTLILGLFFFIIAQFSKNWGLFAIGGVFFLILSIGLFSTGWERYEGTNLVQDINADAQLITPQSITYPVPATDMGNPLTGFAYILLGLALASIVYSLREYNYTKDLESDE